MTVVQTKLNATTSTTPALEFNRLSKLADTLNDLTTGIQSYSVARRPVADSANHGEIIYSTDSSAFYISEQLAWRELAVGDSSIAPAGPSYSFQGSTSGYVSGGNDPTPSPTNVIQKFSFTSNANATDVGDMTKSVVGAAGQSSSDNGYSSGGRNAPPGTSQVTGIDKFSFASDGNGADVGDLTTGKTFSGGQSSADNGYTSGGQQNTPPIYVSGIDKFPFASDGNATDVGDMMATGTGHAGQSSSTHGYNSGGPPLMDQIEKFPFASDGNSSGVGYLTVARYAHAGQSSADNGYASGGYAPPVPGVTNVIDKFSFASDANATDVGDLTIARAYTSGQSSTVSGYTSSGYDWSVSRNEIDKFPFASDANATDVGDTLAATWINTGHQV